MSETLLHCLENLKEITTEQGKQIATLTANMNNTFKIMEDVREDLKEIFTKLDGQNVRLNTVENWQESFEKSDNRKIMIGCGLVGMLNILVSIILVVGFR